MGSWIVRAAAVVLLVYVGVMAGDRFGGFVREAAAERAALTQRVTNIENFLVQAQQRAQQAAPNQTPAQ